MSQHPYHNPTDSSAGTPAGTIYAVILDVKDPQKLGRVMVKHLGSAEGFQKTEENQWLTVNIPGGAVKGGAQGMSPQSYGMIPGDVVELKTLGQQTWQVVGRASKVDPEDQKGDIHPHIKGKDTKFTNENHNSDPQHPGYTLAASDWRDVVDKAAREIDWAPGSVSGYAKRWLNGMLPMAHKYGNWVQNVLQGQAPADFSFRKPTRNKTKAQGMHQFKGILDDATKFMQQVQMPPVIPSAFSMIQNLQATVRSGSNINHTLSVGGAQNVAAAIASAISYASQINKENKQNEENPEKAFLYALYREETGLEPLDENDKETEAYQIWEAEYYRKKEYNEETGLEPLNEDGTDTTAYTEWKLQRGSVS